MICRVVGSGPDLVDSETALEQAKAFARAALEEHKTA
jgi:hypothetical protein